MSPNDDSYLTCNEDKKTVIPEMRVVIDSLAADGIHYTVITGWQIWC